MSDYQTLIGPCGKRIYPSKSVGKKLARRVNQSGRERAMPYHCTKCHGWHIGSQGEWHRTRRRPKTLESV